MTHSQTSILVIFIAVILHGHAFSQQNDSAVSLHIMGKSFLDSDPNKAFVMLQKAMSISELKKDWNLYLKSVNELAKIDFGGNSELESQAFELTITAVNTLKDMSKTDGLAELYFNTAKFYSDLTSDTEQSIKNFEKAKEIWSSLKGEQSKEVADCYHEIGDIYKYTIFDFNAAEKCYEIALWIRQKINFNDRVVLYRNYYSLAATNRSQHDFEKALLYGNKAIEIVQQLEPYRQEQCASMVANIHRDMGNLTLAKKNYFDALKLNEKTNDLDNRAWYYLCLGETFKYDSLTDQALYYFKKAYELYTTPGVKEQALFLSLLINIIDIYALHFQSEKQQKKELTGNTNQLHLKKFVDEIFRELRASNMLKSTEAANVWLILGKHYASKMSYDSALSCYQKALIASVPSFKSDDVFDNPTELMIGYKYYVHEILTHKAAALEHIFKTNRRDEYLKNVLACLELAEKLISTQRNTLDMENSKGLFMEHNFKLYEDIIENLDEARKILPEDSINLLAFKYFERSKSRSLADALAMTDNIKRMGDEDSLFQTQADLKRKLFNVQGQINRALESTISQSELSSARNEIVRIDLQIQTIKMAIEDKYPGYFNVMYGYRAATPQQLQTIVAKHDQLVIEYFWGSNSVYGLGLSDEKIVFKRIGSTDSIKHLINRVLSNLAEQGTSTGLTRYQEYAAAAYQLNEILVRTFAELITDQKRIQIIPDGYIGQLPFEVLLEEMPQVSTVDYKALKYLIKSFPIGYAYSSSMLTHASRRRIASPSMLAMGYQVNNNITASGTVLSPIKGAEQELLALTKRFETGKFFLGADANEANFKTLAPQYDIIHLAVHGTGDINKHFASSLHFGHPQATEDGELHAYELYSLKLKALMAVLSACESGLGKGYRGEGMVSMASAFTYSGCQNILMSLWKVNDQQSTQLMDNFYDNLLEGESIDAALRNTKLQYLENADELSADPKIWAPLVAYGSLDVIFSKDRSRLILIVSIVLIFAMALLTFYKLKNRLRKI